MSDGTEKEIDESESLNNQLRDQIAKQYREERDNSAAEMEEAGETAGRLFFDENGNQITAEAAEEGEEAEVEIVAEQEEEQQEQQEQQEPEGDEEGLPAAAESTGLPWETNEAGEKVLSLKVNGKMVELTEEQALERLRRNESADEKFKSAAQMRREAQAMLEQAQESRSTLPEQSDDDLMERARTLDTKIMEGDEDERIAALAELLKGRDATPQDQIIKEATGKAINAIRQERFNEDMREGYLAFSETYPELDADEDLSSLVDARTTILATEHPEWTPKQVMLEAGKVISEKFNIQKPSSQAQISTGNREQAKRNLKVIPTPANQKVSKEPEKKFPTGSEYIQKLAERRGQAM